MGDWTFFSNYGHVLVCLVRNREARLRDVAREVGITERAVQKIVRDLQDAGFLTVTKQGRCNRYRVNRRKSLRHPLESHCTVGQLLTLVAKDAGGAEAAEDAAPAAAPAAEMAPVTPPAAGGDAPPQEATTEKNSRKKPSQTDKRDQGSLF
jgi:predicted ArsR family transcriptional regulator